MSLLTTTNNCLNVRPIIIVGKNTKKMQKALSFVSTEPIICYANEYDIEDNYSIPKSRGIIIDEVDYKPNTDLIRKTIIQYRGQVVLLSDNQKDVPKSIFNLCKLKRAAKKNDPLLLAPRANQPKQYDMDIFPLVAEYLKNIDRDEVAIMLKIVKPPDIQFLSWLSPNLHPNRLGFVDFAVKRKWPTDYFYELLSYSHNGRMERKMKMPIRGKFSPIPLICRKLKLRHSDIYLLSDLLKDESFKIYAKEQLNNSECRILKIGEKKRRRKNAPITPQMGLAKWV